MKVTFDMERYRNYLMSDMFNEGLKKSLEEVGGIVKHWTDLRTGQEIFEVESMPQDKPIYGVYWITATP